MNRRRDRGPQPRGSGGARTDEISGPAGRPRPPTPSTKQARCVPGRSVRFSIALGEILDQGNDGSTQSGTVDPDTLKKEGNWHLKDLSCCRVVSE
jgi:hypothetical protein